MSVEQTDVIDFVSLDKQSDRVFLTVSDHLPWDGEHLLTLQEKLNAYLRFLESGEVYDHYPSAKGREFVIQVLAMHRPNEEAVAFFELAASKVANAGFTLTIEPGPGVIVTMTANSAAHPEPLKRRSLWHPSSRRPGGRER